MSGGWLIRVGGDARRAGPPRCRVVALPHAGGWPSAFRSWRGALPGDVEFLVAQLPGRGARLGEPPLRRVGPLAEGLLGELAALPPLPWAVVGHSFGSILAYELARGMEQRGLPPGLVVVSARQPPCFPSVAPFAHHRDDDALLAHVVDIGGIAPELLGRDELVRPALAAIRADLEAMETYHRPPYGIGAPLLALGAHDDPIVVAQRLHLWSLETTGPFRRQMFPGGHFFLYEPGVAATVAGQLLSAVHRVPLPV